MEPSTDSQEPSCCARYNRMDRKLQNLAEELGNELVDFDIGDCVAPLWMPSKLDDPELLGTCVCTERFQSISK